MAPQTQEVEQDEFDEAASAQSALSGYEATRNSDVEDQREYRMVPRGTPCTLAVEGFELARKGKAAIFAKIAVAEPEEFADGSSTFNLRLSLNSVRGTKEDGTEKGSTGWDMAVKLLSWLYAAVNQCSSAEGKREMIDCVLAEYPNMELDDVPAFHQALVDNANEKIGAGSTFKTKAIGVETGQPTGKKKPDGTDDFYRDKQSLGLLDYPKSAKK